MTDNEKIASELRAISCMVEDAHKSLRRLMEKYPGLKSEGYVVNDSKSLDSAWRGLKSTANYILTATAEDYTQAE